MGTAENALGLEKLIQSDLDFHGDDSSYASHNFHSFPAKFPPQLPRKFILNLTQPHDIVLDPMTGSGTTVVEAHLNGRVGIGFDIDPIAILLSSIKTSNLNPDLMLSVGIDVLLKAEKFILNGKAELEYELLNKWDGETKEFVDYWFSEEVQLELLALANQIGKIEELSQRKFLQLVFSAIIITKSGGVSLAFDLGHTRPHKAKAAIAQNGRVIFGESKLISGTAREKILVKKYKSPLHEFRKRLIKNVERLRYKEEGEKTLVSFGDAMQLPIKKNSIDLIVTSPPYASNAIDYLRAHKFSLVWLGHSISELGEKRSEYIGGEQVRGYRFETLPAKVEEIVRKVEAADANRALVLRRYYSEMAKSLREMERVLKPFKAAIVVVGNSIMKGVSTETAECLANIGKEAGFQVPGIGIRNLDRNKRMLPVSGNGNTAKGIQQRMHEEYVIAFLKA